MIEIDSSYSIGMEAALQRLSEETQRKEAVDTKASLVLGFAGVLITFLFSIFAGSISSQRNLLYTDIILTIALFALVSSSFCAVAALVIRNYQSGPGNKILTHAVESQQLLEIKKKLFYSYTRAYQHNWRQNQRKVAYLSAGFVTLSVGTFLAFLTFLVFIWS